MNEYWQYRIAATLSKSLPRALSYWIGLRFADRFYSARKNDRAAVIANLRQVLAAQGIEPSQETLEGMSRKTFQYFGKYLVDFFRLAKITKRDLKRFISVEHMENLSSAVEAGKGVLIISAHLGNWELGGGVVKALGHNVNAVVLPNRLQKLENLLSGSRTKRGITPIPLGSAAKQIVKHLRSKEVVALLADRDFSGRNETVTFFGKPARIPRGPATIAKRTEALILPTFILRQVDDTFLVRFHTPIDPAHFPDTDALQQKICRILEYEIALNPHQWFIFEDFWQNEKPQEILSD